LVRDEKMASQMKFDYYRIMPKITTRYSPPGGDYTYAYYIIHPHKLIEAWYYRIKWFIQRGYRGYADCDVWSLEWYLAGWMPEALDRLASIKHGHPFGMTEKGWNTRLKIMRDGFSAVREMEGIPLTKDYKKLNRRVIKGLRLFAEHYLSLWD
jgi:hypothetical protein